MIGSLLGAALVAALAAGVRGGRTGEGGDDAAGVPVATDDARVRVEVLNAAGRSGLAREATRRLRDRGFDVVYFGNAEAFGRDSSIVLDRVGKPDVAEGVAAALGIRRVASEPDSSLLLEVTVLLGLDWPPPEPERSPGLGARIRALLRRARGASSQ
ncbi:MAG TPA: LytR C-terminal domain-containing protein [Longimicrobiales bacterium]